MMIILLDAQSTVVTVISSLGNLVFADKADFFNCSFVLVDQQRSHVPGLVAGAIPQKREVEAEHYSHEGYLRIK